MSFRFIPGRTALIVSMPHVGTELPQQIAEELTSAARALPDTDWHVDRLYDFAAAAGASVLAAQYSRYVVDLNRPPDDSALYPGQLSTGLCPTHSFDGEPLYRDARTAMSETRLAARRESFWRPYHEGLSGALAETQRRCGYALLLDAHSIRSRVPRLFEGRLPDVNVGTDDGRACDTRLVQALMQVLKAQGRFSYVLNGRFKGGYITRHYGAPAKGVQALQLELTQASYMDEEGVAYAEARARDMKRLLEELISTLLREGAVLGSATG